MIRIFNKKKKVEIRIDDTVSWVRLMPHDYEEKPYIKITLEHFDFPRHAQTCSDCKAFLDSFGNETFDWCVQYLGKTKRLDTTYVESGHAKNQIQTVLSYDFTGTYITLTFNSLPFEKEELREILNEAVQLEKYEKACIIRDLINE